MISLPLKYPNKSHRKNISIPHESVELAEFLGIIYGDGGITNPWQIVISLNSDLDRDYACYIVQLCEKLFRIAPHVRKRPGQKCLVIVLTGISLIEFLVSQGMAQGNKIKLGLKIPNWIREDKDFTTRFVRGLVDTDGCLYIHKHIVRGREYKNIGFCYTNNDPTFLSKIAKMIENFGIKTFLMKNNTRIYLYRSASVLKYIEVFGTSNPRIFRKLIEWRGV